jgi:hypothetical protein
MSDRLYLSFWLTQHSALNMHRQFAAAIGKFPFSTQARQAYLRVGAVAEDEPALQEQIFELPAQSEELLQTMSRWTASDTSFEIEGFWDLWQETPEGWRLLPSRVNHFYYAPNYRTENGEHVRFEVGLEGLFLPVDMAEGELKFYQSNIRSLMRLVGDLSGVLKVKKRSLWSESGEDLAAKFGMLAESVSTRRH